MKKTKQKGVSTLIGVIIIIATALVAFGGVFAYQYFSKSQTPITNDQSNPNTQNQNQNSETAGWKTYANTEYGFEMKFPPNFSTAPIITIKDCEYDNFSSQCPVASDVYRKFNIIPTGPDNKDVKRIISDNTPICIYNYGDCGAGSCHLSYWYISAKNNKCLIVDVEGTGITNCGVYGGQEEPNYKACEKRNADTLQKLNQDMPSTFKFTK